MTIFFRCPNLRYIRRLITALVFLTTSTYADDPNRTGSIPQVLPTSASLDTSALREYETTTKWGEQRLIKGEIEGRKTWNMVNSIYAGQNPLIDHIVLDRNTLEYMGRYAPYFAVGNHYLAATIRDGQLSGSLNPLLGGDPIIINTRLTSPVFEEASLGVVLASLPLKIGFRITVPRLAISASTQSFSVGSIEINVTGREQIEGGDGRTYSCWVVEAIWSGVDYNEVHWINDSPPYSIQKRATFPNGRVSKSGFISVSTGR